VREQDLPIEPQPLALAPGLEQQPPPALGVFHDRVHQLGAKLEAHRPHRGQAGGPAERLLHRAQAGEDHTVAVLGRQRVEVEEAAPAALGAPAVVVRVRPAIAGFDPQGLEVRLEHHLQAQAPGGLDGAGQFLHRWP
jgi:hypothetical protein